MKRGLIMRRGSDGPYAAALKPPSIALSAMNTKTAANEAPAPATKIRLSAAIEGGFNAAAYGPSEPLRMINPRFIGRSEQGGPYQLSAELAERPRGENQPIELIAPVYRTEAGTIMLAPRGIYDEEAQTVVFDGEVLFADRGGNRFTTPNMIVDLEQGTLTGRGGVTGAGPLGVLQAESYELRDSDRALVLRGGVRGQIPDRDQQNRGPSP
jgi:hypothetical protein